MSISFSIFFNSWSHFFIYFCFSSSSSFSHASNSFSLSFSSSDISYIALLIHSSLWSSSYIMFFSFFISSIPPIMTFNPHYPTLSPSKAQSLSSSTLWISAIQAFSSAVKEFLSLYLRFIHSKYWSRIF